MMKFNTTLLLVLLTSISLSFSAISYAEENVTETYVQETETYTQETETYTQESEIYTEETDTYVADSSGETSYGHKIGQKALWGLSNTTLGIFEVPKNMIIVTNKSNLLYGLTGGLGLGILNTVGRTAVGINDLLFFLLPTHPVVNPVHPWNNYLTVDTSYGDLFNTDF